MQEEGDYLSPILKGLSVLKSKMPCAECKLLHRRCTNDCIFVPYFPSNEPDKFAAVHRVFGSSNITKMLQAIPINHREDAVKSMTYEANATLKDPVYGCVAFITSLQSQVSQLQAELATLLAENMSLRSQLSQMISISTEADNWSMDYF